MKIQILYSGMNSKRLTLQGDHWVYEYIRRAFVELGHQIIMTHEGADIQIGLLGSRQNFDTRWISPYRVAWIFSQLQRYETKTGRKELDKFHHIYALSTVHLKILSKAGIESAVLPPAAGQKYFTKEDKKYEYDICCINTGTEYRMQIIEPLLKKYKVGLCGIRWRNNFNALQEFWPNEKMGEFYNKAPLSIYVLSYEHYIKRGMVPVRMLDTMVSSDCLCITHESEGLKEIFGEHMPPTFRNKEELLQKVDYYLEHEDERRDLQFKIRKHLSQYTYIDWCKKVLQDRRY